MVIIDDERFRWPASPTLDATLPVTIRMTVDNGVIGDIAIGVRNANHADLTTVGVNGLPLSTGPTGVAHWTFDPASLAAPHYVIWNMWVNYTGAAALQFTITVDVSQGAKLLTATLSCRLDANRNVAAVGFDGLWIK